TGANQANASPASWNEHDPEWAHLGRSKQKLPTFLRGTAGTSMELAKPADVALETVVRRGALQCHVVRPEADTHDQPHERRGPVPVFARRVHLLGSNAA